MAKFANALFIRLSQVKPSIKFRYLKGGFEVVGDHAQAHEARKVSTITRTSSPRSSSRPGVDGGDVEVGTGKPFGVFVNLRHTREIERESGGFGRYLQNQNNNNMFYYNYGRPLENYRDKFQDAAKQALEEHFEVMSRHLPGREGQLEGDRRVRLAVTPYAYLLLKARGPKVDKIPPMRLDLDFMDTSGYVVMPVESPTIPVDASTGRRRRPPVREAPAHPDARRAAGEGRQADPRDQGGRPRPGARPRRHPRPRPRRLPGREGRRPGPLGLQVRPGQRGDRDRLGADLAGLLPRRRRPAEAPRHVPVRLGQGRRAPR